jgi:IclR family transcriptional regulator, pca regulon regulatory protein
MAVKTVEALKKGLDILQVFTSEKPHLKLQEITKATGIPKATAYRLLKTLIDNGYVHYFPDSTTFHLGPKVMSLGFSSLSALDLTEVAHPYLEDLSRRIDQNVNLGILDGIDIVYVIRVKKRRILGINLQVGSRLPAHNTAIGQAVLAFLGPGKIQSVVKKLSEHRERAEQIGANGRILLKRLARVRERGYALSDGEFAIGLRSLSVPVFKEKGEVEAAINVPVHSQLYSRETLVNDYLPSILEVARTLSLLRGCRADAETSSGKESKKV